MFGGGIGSGGGVGVGGGAMSPYPRANHQKHTLRQRQKDMVREMIRSAVPLSGMNTDAARDVRSGTGTAVLNSSADEGIEGTWKLLVYDDVGRDIIAPLLNVGDLRELGVTLHMHINKPRDPVPYAPVVYFCAPTDANIAAIAKDCVNELYEWVYVNFTAQVPRRLLEILAEQLAAGRTLTSIRHIKVLDRTLSYISLYDDLFSLMLHDSFRMINSRKTAAPDMEAHLNAIVQGISHVLLSQQIIPVIAHSKTDVASGVASLLSGALHDYSKESRRNLGQSSNNGRPLLLLVDRSSDLATALHHPFTYRGLLVDNFGMALNKVSVKVDGTEKVFDLDPDVDTFYRDNGLLDFGSIANNVLSATKDFEQERNDLVGRGGDGNGFDDDDDAASMSRMLANAPMMASKKRCIDAHNTLAVKVLDLIHQNNLDSFHGVELGMIQHDGLDCETFKKLLKGLGTKEDRMRLYLIAVILRDSESFVDQCLADLGDMPFPALQYIRHLRSWMLNSSSPTNSGSSGSPSALQGYGWGIAEAFMKGITSTLGGEAEAELPLTRLVAALLDDTANQRKFAEGVRNDSAVRAQLLDTVSGLDPITQKPVELSQLRFSQVIVFAVGGGCVAEYDDLKRWEQLHPNRPVSYGCTDLLTGNAMLEQLGQLGSEIA